MRILLIALMSFFMLACNSKRYMVEGLLVNHKSESVILQDLRDSTIAEARIGENGEFSITGKIDNRGIYFLRAKKDYLNVPIYIDGGDYTLEKVGRDYLVFGAPNSIQTQYTQYMLDLMEIEKEGELLPEEYENATELEEQIAVGDQMTALFEKKVERTLKAIEDFEGNGYSYYIAYENIYVLERDPELFSRAIVLLDGNPSRDNAQREVIYDKYEQLMASRMSGVAPDFELPNVVGEMVKLSSLRGNYVVLDFWASWCVPCRKKNRELKECYAKLTERGIVIVSVSLDEDKGQWMNALKEDQPQWMQLIDQSGFNKSEIRKQYKVKAIPTVYLINPQGEIIATNPTIDSLLEMPV